MSIATDRSASHGITGVVGQGDGDGRVAGEQIPAGATGQHVQHIVNVQTVHITAHCSRHATSGDTCQTVQIYLMVHCGHTELTSRSQPRAAGQSRVREAPARHETHTGTRHVQARLVSFISICISVKKEIIIYMYLWVFLKMSKNTTVILNQEKVANRT